MSEQLISSLQQRLDELTRENATLKAESKDRRLKARDLKTQLEELSVGYQTLESQLAEAQQRSDAAPHELQAEVDRLRGEIRTRDHKGAFAKLAKDHNVREDALEALWKVSGYTPEGDEPDESKISEVIGAAVRANPWSQAAAERPNEQGGRPSPAAPPHQAVRPGPGMGRGVNNPEHQPSALTRINDGYARTRPNRDDNPGRIA